MKLIILNHKSYLGIKELEKYKKEIEKIKTGTNIVLFPNILYLSIFKDSKLNIGSQNFYSYNYGSYTGEISLASLKELNITYTLIGHPERIMLHLDTYEQIKDKLYKSLNSNFKTILCIGSTNSLKMIKKELKYYLKGIEEKSLDNLILAYEPIDKIENAIVNLEEITLVINYIKSYTKKHLNKEIPVIYGGSVDKENIKEILSLTDGVLIGKISTDINITKEIIKSLEN